MGSRDKVGIIVPVLDDSVVLRRFLSWRKMNCPETPIWVVDGGSSDGTVAVVREFKAVLIDSEKGRAIQMNMGARAAIAAKCDVLWFLHADAMPPSDAIERMQTAVNSGAIAGGFKRRFDYPSLFLKWTCLLADWRCRSRGWFLGDQGMFVTRGAFEELGGFPDWPWFEDLEFSRKLAKRGRVAWIDSELKTSGRRFERLGAWRQTWRDFSATQSYLRSGKPPPLAHGETNPNLSEIIAGTERPSSR
jgi:rSAM/selenodomain-associated transferase 2